MASKPKLTIASKGPDSAEERVNNPVVLTVTVRKQQLSLITGSIKMSFKLISGLLSKLYVDLGDINNKSAQTDFGHLAEPQSS